MSKNNGGPAFPGEQYTGQVEYVEGIGNRHVMQPTPGMSLRDYFATHAPIGYAEANDAFYRANGRNPGLRETMEMLAYLRGIYADAMLAEREK